MRIKYVNHVGETIIFGQRPYFINADSILKHEYSYTSSGGRITGISRFSGVLQISPTVFIYATSEKTAAEEKEHLHNVLEKDTASGVYGKLWVGEYYINCLSVSSTPKQYKFPRKYLEEEIKFITDVPVWRREIGIRFTAITESTNSGIDYPYDYSHDFGKTGNILSVINDGFAPCGFELIIYGACTNPTIKIGDQTYSVRCDVGTGEILIITSIGEQKTIVLYAKDGSMTNKFNNRDKVNNCFAKIAVGQNKVVWNNDFNFDLIMIDERGEPKWN